MRCWLMLFVAGSVFVAGLTGCADDTEQLTTRLAALEGEVEQSEARIAALEAEAAAAEGRLARVTRENERLRTVLHTLALEHMTALPVAELDDLQAVIAETAERDQILVLDFWATWCIPCVAIFPDLHAGLKAMGDRVRPVSVTLDDPGEWEQRAIQFLAEHEALEDAYRLVSTSEGQVAVVEGLGERWTDLVVPAILIYDAEGNLAGEFLDDNPRTERILARVREVAGEGTQTPADSASAR